VALGDLFEQIGEGEHAIASYGRAVELDPVNPSLARLLAMAYSRHDRLDEAYMSVDRGLSIKLRPEDRKYAQLADLAHFGLGLSESQGDDARAARYRSAEANFLAQIGISR
jgi:tetratricopeptide (TPR) repeat protein